MVFVLEKLLTDVFDPQPGELVLVACDLPAGSAADSAAWRERRAMAAEWHAAFEKLGRRMGFEVLPLVTYAATGSNGAELPSRARMGEQDVSLEESLLRSTLAAFLTQFSATAPLDAYCRRKQDFRAASMPGIQKSMEATALSADYREVARRCAILEQLLVGAERLEVRFSTGHRCGFDLRHRKPEVDDGFLPRGKRGDRIINLPSGETFIVPYEGEQPGQPSLTQGELPLRCGAELAVLQVHANRITAVVGAGPQAARLRQFFAEDPARANVAEVAFGCNDHAQVTGNVLEDEKAGFHWAYGRSDHLGGVVGVKDFARPANVVHQDVVYAKESPIQVAEATLLRPGSQSQVMRDGAYVVF